MNILEYLACKGQKKISVVTCYDYWSACIIEETQIDVVLVGDTSAMLMHGHSTTLPMTIDTLAMHVAAVARGINKKLIIGDLPFLSYRKGLYSTMKNIEKIMQAGAHAIKLEGATDDPGLIKHIVGSGVPVMGHIGLTPQAIHQLGGFCVQGTGAAAKEILLKQAKILEEAGCFSLVLECMPSQLAKKITESLSICTIGIGAGPHTDGQVLVLQDLLGLNPQFKAKFLKTYLDGFNLMKAALNEYDKEVKMAVYPGEEHLY